MSDTKPDTYQQQAIITDKSTLLIAAAGSGKTFTIVHKIKYLTEKLMIAPKDILIISFTNKSVADLQRKINLNADIYTFHKLAMAILKYNHVTFNIAADDLLEYLTKEFFLSLTDVTIQKMILKYYHFPDYQSFLKSRSFTELVKIIINFIHLYKTNNKTLADLKKIYKTEPFLLKLILIIMTLYNQELKSTQALDFDDIIIMATKYAANYKKYRYIIIDEFQDTSQIRWNLINQIRLSSQATIFVVGDDYQSIFKFSGCDINIFLNFTNLVADSQILKLRYTYRNSQELINYSSKFIMQNSAQIKKELLSPKHLKKPIIIKYYFNATYSFTKVLKKIMHQYQDILVLGRNNFDLKKFYPAAVLENDIFLFQGKPIKYLTVHSAKGLEADVVLIINLEDSLYGFPNKIVNNKIIREMQAPEEKILYAEERRLFYVALTRTRNEVYLLCPIINKSPFVKEIKKIIKAG